MKTLFALLLCLVSASAYANDDVFINSLNEQISRYETMSRDEILADLKQGLAEKRASLEQQSKSGFANEFAAQLNTESLHYIRVMERMYESMDREQLIAYHRGLVEFFSRDTE